jgi:hypothetical protein
MWWWRGCGSLQPATIIVASGYSEAQMSERFSGDRHMSFLGKPYDVEQVSATLRGLGVGA